MKEQLKIEAERVIKGKFLWLSLSIGCIIAIAQIMFELYPYAKNPLAYYNGHYGLPFSVFQFWMGMNFASPYKETFLTIFPVLAMLPYALTYHSDIKNGYVKNIYTRNKKKNYLMAKYIVTFMSAGIVVTIPYLLNLIIALCLLPALSPVRNGQYMSAASMLQNVFYSRPFLYIVIYLIISFLYAGVFASVTLAATCIVENIFLLSLVPFLLWYGLGIISSFFIARYQLESINPIQLLDMAQAYIVQMKNVLGTGLAVGGVSAIIYFRNGVKSDVL